MRAITFRTSTGSRSRCPLCSGSTTRTSPSLPRRRSASEQRRRPQHPSTPATQPVLRPLGLLPTAGEAATKAYRTPLVSVPGLAAHRASL